MNSPLALQHLSRVFMASRELALLQELVRILELGVNKLQDVHKVIE